MAVYSAMIDRLDQNIGRLLDKLEEFLIQAKAMDDLVKSLPTIQVS